MANPILMQKHHFLLPLLLICLLAPACKYKVDDGLNWDQNLVAPILKSRMGLAEALKDSSLVNINNDQSITIVFRDTLVSISLSDYLVVPDTSYSAKITLDSISLATDTLVQDITMQQIADELCTQGQTVFCNIAPGTPLLFGIPPISNVSAPAQNINASQFFQEADLISGWMVVELENHLPMDINSASFHLRNNGQYQDTLVKDTIYNIYRGSTVSTSASLAGKTVESIMAAQLENISTAQAPPFNYDPNQYLRIRIIVHSLRASRATAVFPAQRVIDDYSRINYRFDNGVEITQIKSKTGHLILNAISTLQDTIDFSYSLPTAIKNGQAVRIHDRLVPGPNGGVANIDLELDDYYIDMTLNGDSVNLFPYHLIGDMLYSGRLNTMDLQDSINITYGLQGIVPSYIEGYLGQSSFNFRDSLKFDFFNAILGGSLDLHAPTVTLNITNSIGVDGELTVRQLDAINHRTNQSVSLTGQLMNGKTEVRGPKLPNVGQSVSTSIALNNGNSNIRQFLSLLPDEIQFDMDVLVNRNGNPALHDNFATDQSALAAYLDIEVPLDGITDHLWLQDTLEMNLGNASLPKGIEDGRLKLVASNQFPFAAEVQVLFMDVNGSIFDSLFTSGPALLPAGHVGLNGMVDIPGTGQLIANFDQMRFTRLKQRGKSAITRFVLSTQPTGQHVKLFTTYGIDFHLVGDFRTHIGS
jgi:hypothetical protein